MSMMNDSRTGNDGVVRSRRAVSLVLLMITSLFVSMAPYATASHTTQYGVQRDPLYISIGDLDCDGDNDIASGSGMGHFLSFLYNDGSGGFGDRQDIQISNNDSFRAGFRDVADGNRVEIADVDGDDVNDIIYYQQNVRFVGESFVRPANLTVLKGVCDERVNLWEEMFDTVTVVNPYLQGFDVGDINGDGNVDVVFSSTDATFANQFIQIYKGPDYSLPANQHAPISVPLTNGLYTAVMLGNWGEDLQTNPLTGDPIPGECVDLDIWLLRTPPYNAGVGYSAGTFDNMTVLEYDCLTGTYPNPMDPTSTGTMHDFTLDAEHDYPLYGIDIADTTDDDNIEECEEVGCINLIAAVDGITGNISYATKNGGNWDTQNYVPFGDYLAPSVTIADVNQDGEVDFFVPTSLTLLDTQESTVQNQTYLLRPNLRALNTVQILLADPDSDGYLSPLSFDVGRRPTMAMPGQLQGGDSSALEVVIGQADYTYRFSNNAMWLDTQGYAGQGDYLSVLALDNFDLGITRVEIEPSVMDPATFQSIVGEGNRWVNVTIKNTGLMPISGGSLDVDLEVREVIGGTDTIVYFNDFESSSANINTGAASFNKYSYTGEYSTGNSSWHLDEDRHWESGVTYQEDDVVHYNNTDYMCGNNNTTSCTTNPEQDNSSWEEVAYYPWEAEANPTNYYWAGVSHTYDFEDGNSSDVTGYYNHMDEALILEDVDLSGADAAFLDMDAICSAGFFQLFLAEPYDVIERWLYEDSCSIEVWSDGNGWEPVWRFGGWDNERKYRIEDRVSSAPDPEYNDYNGDFYGDWHSTLWNNYTEAGGVKDSCYMPYLAFGYPIAGCYEDGELDQKANTIDLTPYAGQMIDIRFRFRSGLEGSVGPDGSADNSALDGFAIDNITIRKRDVTFGDSTVESQELTNLDLVAGESITVQLTADFIDNTTYYVSTKMSNADLGGNQPDQDMTNDEVKFQLTVKNLYDPGLIEEPWLDLVNGERYASGQMPITIGVQNWGNTVVDFEVEAKVRNALPELIAAEDFSGFQPIWEDDGNENGSRLDDSTGSNDMLPQNQGVFKNQAYWLGHPSDGYGDNWNETLTIEPIEISDSGADFTFLSFDYFAEGDHIADRNGNVQSVRDFSYLEITWVKEGEVYEGIIYGSWTDLNDNGLRYAYNPYTDSIYNYCEDFDQNGLYEEVEYAGDHSGDIGEDGWVSWFDSDNLVSTSRIDLTHVHLLNQTSDDSFGWTEECTSLAGSEVTFTWRFYSNDDGVNGNAGYAGFAIDNIRVDDYTFTDDGMYTEPVSGMDAAQRRVIEIGTHDFESGLYRIDLMTMYDNTDNTSKWFGKPEISQANNVSTILFEIANADITLLQADVLDCVADPVYNCVYATNPLGQESHDFAVPMLNGVIEGIYEVTMRIVDEDTGQTVYQQESDNGPFVLDPHQRSQANWTSPYDQWFDGHTYNISFFANLTETGESSGNERFFSITFKDHIDVAILSDPTDQSRLQRVKSDLDAMNKTYTQLEVEDWSIYGKGDWFEHYSKILLPWQTDYNVEYGDYYEILGTPNPDNSGLTLTETLVAFMQDGGTLQVHLGPYRSNYLSMGNELEKLPFDMDIVMRNHVNLTTDQRIHSENISIVDEFHPMMSGIDTSAFAGINGGTHVALSGLDTSQVNAFNLPLVCRDGAAGGTEGGRISDGGTFHTLIRDSENPSQSLISTCNYQMGGMIVTTIDVENPAVSQPFGDANFPLLSNMLDFHLTPYPDGFEIAGEGFHLTIDGQTQPLDVLTGAYQRTAIKSGATLEFSFESDVTGLVADWVIESSDGTTITGWDGEALGDENRHVSQDDPSSPVSSTFCVTDESAELGCKIDAEWRIWLFLHDSAGHTRITNISIYTNDINADNTPPIAHVEIIEDSVFQELVEFVGYQQTPTGKLDDEGNWIMIDSPKYRVRLSDTGTTDLKFSAANSSDVGTGIMTYTWTISGDGNQDHVVQLPSSQVDWHYTFRNLTPNQNPIMIELEVTDMRGQDSSPTFRIFFEVVGEQFGDDEPQVEMDSINTADGHSFSALEVDIVNITGIVTDNDISSDCDVTVEAVLDDITILDASPAIKTTNHELGRYDYQSNLCDGDTYTLTLNISHLYMELDGNAGMIHVRVTEGSYQVNEQIQLYTVPRPTDPCEIDPASCEGNSGSQISGAVFAGVGALLLIAILAITLLVVRGRKTSPEEDSVESFGGVEQMDPIEAYTQQLVAQGYDEQVARQYATQYYAQYYEKQRGGGG
jgi:hypothetical protein